MHRRRPLLVTVFLSALLHAALVALLLSERPAERPIIQSTSGLAVEWVVVDVERALPAPPDPAPPVAAVPNETPRPKSAQPRPERSAPQAPAAGSAEATPSAREPADAPLVAENPGRSRLLPLPGLADGSDAAAEGSRGRTLYPDDPSLSAWAKREEEAFRVHRRVDGWAKDTTAEARAQRGLPHPYLGGVGTALREGLGAADGGTPNALGAPSAVEHLAKRYFGAAEQFAKTGNPGVSIPGLAERQSEKQKKLLGGETRMGGSDGGRVLPWAQLYTQAAETLQDLSYGAPLLSLTLELRQARDGSLRDERVVTSSGSAGFDAFVLRVVPEVIATLGPVPEEALRGNEELRSVWLIEGWPRLPPKLEEAMTMFGTPAAFGVPMDTVLKQAAADERFDFRARLLRAY